MPENLSAPLPLIGGSPFDFSSKRGIITMEGSEAPSRIHETLGGRRGLRPVGLEVGSEAVPDR
jgi:hypothetical protein